tara:strand:+ start:41 stop:268 length:228 start_codon:yes stop_codon:yes gene_type:complete
MSDDENIKIYEDLFEHAMHLLNDHQKPVEVVAGSMMAIAQRLYRTSLTSEEYRAIMQVAKDVEVKPYDIKKVRLH